MDEQKELGFIEQRIIEQQKAIFLNQLNKSLVVIDEEIDKVTKSIGCWEPEVNNYVRLIIGGFINHPCEFRVGPFPEHVEEFMLQQGVKEILNNLRREAKSNA